MSYTQSQIESSFEEMKASFNKRSNNQYTWIQNAVRLMLDYDYKIWWWSWELNNRTNSLGEYISYKWCTRASDLAIHHPDLVEDRKIWRFSIYRLRTENMDLINKFLNN